MPRLSDHPEIKHARLLRHARIPMLLALLLATFLVMRVPILQVSNRKAQADPPPVQATAINLADVREEDEKIAADPTDHRGKIQRVELVEEDLNHGSRSVTGDQAYDAQSEDDRLTDEEIAQRDLNRLKETVNFFMHWVQECISEQAQGVNNM